VTNIINLALGKVILRGCQAKPAFLEGQGHGIRQGFPVGLMRTGELDVDLVDGVFLVVMRCLRS
jgi:hypothetical protein